MKQKGLRRLRDWALWRSRSSGGYSVFPNPAWQIWSRKNRRHETFGAWWCRTLRRSTMLANHLESMRSGCLGRGSETRWDNGQHAPIEATQSVQAKSSGLKLSTTPQNCSWWSGSCWSVLHPGGYHGRQDGRCGRRLRMVEAARWIRKPGLRAKADKEGDIFLGPWSLVLDYRELWLLSDEVFGVVICKN
jgi:hypothetical protein